MQVDIIENVRTTLKVENMDIKGFCENLLKEYLNNNITEDEAVEYIKKDILSRGEYNV